MTTCKSCGKDMTLESTHWVGCYETHPQCAAYKAGLRRAAEIVMGYVEALPMTVNTHEAIIVATAVNIHAAILSEADK